MNIANFNISRMHNRLCYLFTYRFTNYEAFNGLLHNTMISNRRNN